MDVIVCTTGVGNVLRTSVCYGLGWNLSWWPHSDQNVQGTLNAVKYKDDSLDHIVIPFLQQRNFDHVFQHDNLRYHVAHDCQDFLNQNHIRVLPWPALSPDLSPIEHLLDELGRRRVRHRKHYNSCVTHDWFYASEMRSCSCCKRSSHTLLNSANFHTVWQFLFVHDLFW